MSDPDTEDYNDEDLGSLTVEDDPDGTVDPSELAGSGEGEDDEQLPEYSEDNEED